MLSRVLRSLLVAASFLFSTLAAAQLPGTRPSNEQAQILLQTRPDLVSQLRQRFASSGLTRDQIHARLRAEGYPEDLLDPYLPGMAGTIAPPPSNDVFSAVRALGIADSADVAALQDTYGTVGLGALVSLPCYVQSSGGQISIVSPVGPPYGNGQVGSPYNSRQPGDTTTGQRGQGFPSQENSQGSQGSPGYQPSPISPGIQSGQQNPAAQQQPNAQGQTGQMGTYNQPLPTTPPALYGQPIRPCDDRTQQGQRQFDPRTETMLLGRDSLDRVGALVDSGFSVFGLEVFRNQSTQFDPNVAGPVDANYRLGPGDRLVLILTGDVEAAYDLPVTREGFVVVPQVGQLFVANLTMREFERLLYSRLSRVYSGVRADNRGTTRFSVNVARLRSNQVYVVGDVRRPGSFLVSSAGTALTALYAAGGPSLNGSLRRIEIRRAGRTVDSLDVYDYLVRGDASRDGRLQNGDFLFVPVHGPRVRILGEIVRPATYELKGYETLTDLLRYAGGFEANASRQRVLVERIVPPEERAQSGRDRISIDVSSAVLMSSTGPTIPLQDGDIVHVFPVAERMRNRVIVLGNVVQTGAQGMSPGMRLSDALRRAGLKPDTYLGEVLVSRLRSDSSRMQLRATLADSTGAVVNDFALQEDDQIQVFSLTTFRPARYVSIGGAVRRSGRVLFREGMTLRDLVLLASGLAEGASLKEAEIARLPESRSGGRTATTLRVPLDSTYLLERAPDGRYVGPPGIPVPAAGAPDVVLRPYDNVLILRQPDFALQRTVVIQGEVRYPGTYALTSKSERLSDLIKRAGGLTDEAYRDGITFSRRENAIGRVGVELSSAMRRYESPDNLILRDGDNISVPAYNAVVTIRGEVNAPSTVAYVRGKGIDYYIGAAGGATPKADESHAYVTQPSGKLETVRNHLLLPAHMPKPRPGSVVTVPVNDGAAKRDTVALITGLAQIIGSAVAIIIAVTR
jgi:polysaccharide biosynthesis/export protein